MAGTFLQFMLGNIDDEIEWGVRRKIRNYIVDLLPEPVRKIVGLMLLIFVAVVMLAAWITI